MLAIALSSASRRRVAMAASILRASAGTASSTPLNWRCPSTSNVMSVSEVTVAERGRRSSSAISPKYCPGPSVATLRLFRLTAAWPLTMRKNSRPMVPCSQSMRSGGTVTSSSALRMVRRSLADDVENSQIFERSSSFAMAADSSRRCLHVPVYVTFRTPCIGGGLAPLPLRSVDCASAPYLGGGRGGPVPPDSDGVRAALAGAHAHHGLG